MGISTLVLPHREFSRAGKLGEHLFWHPLYKIKDSISDKVKILVYGKRFMEELAEEPNVHFSSLSWFLSAKRGIVYEKEKEIPLEEAASYKCDCQFCRKRERNELIKDVKSLALHNLSQAINAFEG